MPLALASTSPQPSLCLNLSQCNILNALGTKDDVTLRKLIRSMADKPLAPAEEIAIASEVKLQCDLLALANMVIVSKKDGSILYRRRRTARINRSSSPFTINNDAAPRKRYPIAPLTALSMATALALAACAQVSTTKTVQPYNPERFNSANHPMLSERIVQVAAQNGQMQYRYCVGEECPAPTPKVPVRVTERTLEQLGAPPGRARIQDQKSLQDALSKFGKDAAKQAQIDGPLPSSSTPEGLNRLTAAPDDNPRIRSDSAIKPTAKVISKSEPAKPIRSDESPVVNATKGDKQPPTSSAVQTVLTKSARLDAAINSNPNSLPSKATEATLKVASTGDTQALQMDTSFSSYDGLISFNNGSQSLDGVTRDMVAKLAPLAREADLVRLRGHAASKALTEDHRKLAIGRSVAVKLEFIKNGVERTKIRILNPKDNDLIDPINLRAPSNRSVEIHIDSNKKRVG